MISSIYCKQGIAQKGECLLIGIELNEQFIGWSECVGLSDLSVDDPAIVYDVAAAMKTVQEIVLPALHKRPFPTLQSLSAQLETLTETVTVVESLPIEIEAPSATVSRRNILTGNFETNVKSVEPQINQTKVKRPLPAPLQFGISHAYLTAVCKRRNQPMAQVVADMYELDMDLEQTAVSIHITVNDDTINATQPILTEHVTSLGYEIGSNNVRLATNAEAILGSDGQQLHQLVRQVSGWIPTLAPEYHPRIHLNLQGIFGDLFDQNVGKILGALYGLDYVAKPYHVRIENLLHLNDDTISNLQRLKSSFPVRKMNLTLMTSLSSLSAMQAFVDADAVDGVHLRLSQLGDLHKTILFLLDCKKRDLTVMVSGGSDGLAETAVHIAIATGADLVTGPPTQLFNEMQQTLSLGIDWS